MIVLKCGHAFNTRTLDGVMELNKVYETDPESGLFLRPAHFQRQEIGHRPQCPTCRTPIVDIKRFVLWCPVPSSYFQIWTHVQQTPRGFFGDQIYLIRKTDLVYLLQNFGGPATRVTELWCPRRGGEILEKIETIQGVRDFLK